MALGERELQPTVRRAPRGRFAVALLGLVASLPALAKDQLPGVSTEAIRTKGRHLEREGDTKIEPKTQMELVWIPGGNLNFGCEPQDVGCFDDEKPKKLHMPGFWIDRTDITVINFKACVDAGACRPAGLGPGCNWGSDRSDHPINCVSWNEARVFCAWVGERLPSAEEWEHAAKGGRGRIYPWGDEPPTNSTAKYKMPWTGTEPVASRPGGASKQGLLDLVGNIGQWTSTAYDVQNKEVRGGPAFLRVSNRGKELPVTRHSAIGFRCLEPGAGAR